MARIVFHIDVNSAYLSWEAKDRLEQGETLDIREVPSVIAGDPKKRTGVILAKSYPCKKYGIVTGESLYSAVKKCKDLLIFPPNGKLYKENSDAMFKIFEQYSDRVQKYSIDEGFIEYTGMEKLLGNHLKIANEIRKRIKNELGFTVSVGVSSNKILAKMATDLRKPNFTNTLFLDELEKIWVLPVEKLFMVGKETAKKLRKYNIRTIGNLAKTDPKFLEERLGKQGIKIWQYANGIDNTEVKVNFPRGKSIGHSRTFSKDEKNIEEIERMLLGLAEKTCRRLRDEQYISSLVKVEYTNDEFITNTKQKKLTYTTDNTNDIYKVGKKMMRELLRTEKKGIRKIGISLGRIEEKAVKQISMFDENFENREIDKVSDEKKIDILIDKIRNKYGEKIITRGSTIKKNIPKEKEFLHNLNIRF